MALSRYVHKRYLDIGGNSFEGILQLHVQEPLEDQVSRSTLLRSWEDHWQAYMPFRKLGQGKRCKDCPAVEQERLNATTPEERAEVAAAKKTHLDQVEADRLVNTRGNHMSERDARTPTMDGSEQILKIQLDGMDQSKYILYEKKEG